MSGAEWVRDADDTGPAGPSIPGAMMSPLRLVPSPRESEPAAHSARVPLSLLLALTGRCSCEDCRVGYARHPAVGRLSPLPVALYAVR